MSRLIIWWTTNDDCREAELLAHHGYCADWPAYLVMELVSRGGRNGRGRLWVPTEIDLTEIPWPEDHPVAQLADEAGGIVLHRHHLHHVLGLPGFVTDLEFNLIRGKP